jgi:hypothetical protein
VVVGSIDSGVRYTHEALKSTFRGARLPVCHNDSQVRLRLLTCRLVAERLGLFRLRLLVHP